MSATGCEFHFIHLALWIKICAMNLYFALNAMIDVT